MIDLENFKQEMEILQKSMSRLMQTHDQIMQKLSKENPEQFEQIAKDTRAIREAKTIEEINKIMLRYADINNK